MNCVCLHSYLPQKRSKFDPFSKLNPLHFAPIFIIINKTLMLANLLSNHNQTQQNAKPAFPFLDMNLLSKAVEKILKFDTEKESFNRTYPQTDHLQKFYHQTALDHFVDVMTKRYANSKDPISIVDLCCGYGRPTLALRERLEKSGVKVERIVGYDVSEDMIRFANLNNTFQTQVHFERKNIETEYNNVEEFDVAICLFGLHWINDFESTLQAISHSLKPGGIFLTLTPLGLPDLFEERSNFINYSKWSRVFDKSAKTIHPFHNHASDYTQPLSKYFKLTYSEQKLIEFKYTREQFVSFLQSWLQEVRHLTNDVTHEAKKNAIARAYLSDFVDSIEKRSKEGSVTVNEDGSVVLRHRTVDIDGEKL